ncbi:type I-E CRISPR-associated protein Cse1/CasA [Klebsiella sp. 141153]|uniref:type I-E CRISPR-associated protein Cse1/CasA n=1 Tax=Klebsiella sp. 141153 TaxID=3020033 RepID=UPI0029292EFD|nr:type I-E CRISPR-associated protein Cse1/CasA [Klebsiella sp. 141153]MDU9357748.1 type I-E CRISPR-associated protein Cse1/CasA [Klebsiella sp. 141153]
MENRFNLIDEPWIAVVDVGLVSLTDIFSQPELRALNGNPVQKIALTKLLLAIAQAAATPADDSAWQQMGWQGMANRCLQYLAKWHDRFYLYGEKPFLQMPAIQAAKRKSFGTLSPEVSTGNTTVLTESQQQQPLTDADKALTIVTQMGFGLGGKKTDNSVVLTPGYRGKQNKNGNTASGKPGVSVGGKGFLHSYWLGNSIVQSIWLNLFTAEDIAQLVMYPTLGTAPWERMPTGEDDDIVRSLKTSLLGRLIPMGKFCLLAEDGIHYSDGISHAGHLEGKTDPTVSVDFSAKKTTPLWVNPGKRPWRELTSLLQFIAQGDSRGFETRQLSLPLQRITRSTEQFAVWSGGLRVSIKAGEQYPSGTDDYVQSEIWLSSDLINSSFLEYLKYEMTQLEAVQKQLWGAVVRYFRQLSDIDKSATGKAQPFVTKQAEKAAALFWHLCERHAQALIDACLNSVGDRSTRLPLRKMFVGYAEQVFDQLCPADSARQIDAWAQFRPNFCQDHTVD